MWRLLATNAALLMFIHRQFTSKENIAGQTPLLKPDFRPFWRAVPDKFRGRDNQLFVPAEEMPLELPRGGGTRLNRNREMARDHSL